MIICHCEGVTHLAILEAVTEGARTVAAVGRACGAGTRCGGCRAAIHELVESVPLAEPRFASCPAVTLARARA
jgi:assimilatory nitrate reductase electron transfer subunit